MFEKVLTELESMIADFLNDKITKEELQNKYQGYCDMRDM